MKNVLDVANWFIFYNDLKRNMFDEDTDEITNLKLQKLLYYAQSAFLAIKGEPLFSNDIVAWKHGPVIEEVYKKFKSYGSSGIVEFDKKNLDTFDEETQDVLESVYNLFGQYSAWGLRNLTHEEMPWKTTKLNQVIAQDKMQKTFKEKYIEA